MNARRRSVLRAAAIVELVAVASGAALSASLGGSDAAGLVRGGFTGAIVAAPLFMIDLVLVDPRRGRALRELPFGAALLLRAALQVGLILVALILAALVSGKPGGAYLTPVIVLVAIAVALELGFLWQVSAYLGTGSLLALVTGRYRHPRVEELVLLFVDLAGSTSIADRLGPSRFMSLLAEIADDMSPPISDGGGQIHRYVGDETIITWRTRNDLVDARPIETCFAMIDAVAAQDDKYDRLFGVRPAFHAALHIGPVIIGEIGDLHREVAVLGDTMNVTARIEAESRPMGHAVLASAKLIERIGTLPRGITTTDLGPIALRGRFDPLVTLSREVPP